MDLISQARQIEKKIKGNMSFNEDLSKFSWFNLGGPAKIVFRPKDLKDLSFFLREIKAEEEIKVMGVGSNTLIRDGGFNGIIIRLGPSFSRMSKLDSNNLICGASALDKQVSKFALNNSLSGFEFFSCIPGTIGGAIRMNSGCYNDDISKALLSVQVMDFNGNVRIIPFSKIKFHYRGSNLDENLIFLSASFKGNMASKESIEKKMTDFSQRKKKSQPSNIKTCGSTFKNLKFKKAWELIKESGCDGMQIGDAKISEKHCNFFVNKGNASSANLEKLINEVKKIVHDKTGIKLELELQIIGENL